jgi:hypothetical protein
MKYKQLKKYQVESNSQLISFSKYEIVGIIREAHANHYYRYDWKGK